MAHASRLVHNNTKHTLARISRKALLASAIAVASQASLVQAAGYGINEQSASYLGTGFAGRASNAVDASISASNPAAISMLEGKQIAVGTDYIMDGGEFEGSYTGPGGTISRKTKKFQSGTLVPFGYFTMPVNDKLSFGLASYAPYGIELDYKNNWAGKYFGDKTSVKVVNLQGTLAYKFTDDVSVGFGLVGSYVKGELTQKSWLPAPVPVQADAIVEGDDTTIGWNIGATWNVTEATTLGLAYHSKLEFELKGDFKIKNASPAVAPNQKLDASLKITMPEKVLASVTHKIDDRWTVMSDVTWTRWSRFEQFHVVTTSPNVYSYVPMNWKNTWAFSLGTSYQYNDDLLLRAGYMFDESPVTDKTRTVRSPDSDRNWFTLGANYKLSENMDVDFAYAYVKLKKSKIDEDKHNKDGSVNAPYGRLVGEYNNSSHIIGVQLNYVF
ncbi:OmpP1/FadL family transporter [Endozoicomonadaceae bacterium StTr2]